MNQGDASFFLGWVEGYKSSEGTVVQGYPNPGLKSQPIFLLSESKSTGRVANLSFSKDLTPDFRDFIVSVSDQFSPPGRSTPSVYSLTNENVDKTPFFDATQDRRLLAELPLIRENIKVLSLLKDDVSISKDGKISEQIKLNSNSFVKSYTSRFKFSLDNLNSIKGGDDVAYTLAGTNLNFTTSVKTELTLVETVLPSASFIQ